MCAGNTCGCNPGGTGASTAGWVALILLGWAARAVGYAALVVAVVAWRWASGAPMWGDHPTVLGGWPRWQLTAARLTVTVPAVTAVWWPYPTAVTVAALAAGTAVASTVARQRTVRRTRPLRVPVQVRRPAAAITSDPTADTAPVTVTEVTR